MKSGWAAGLLLLALFLPAHAGDLGRRVFTELAQPSCKVCHTLSAAGATGSIGPSLDELKPDVEQVLAAVRSGVGVMPPFAGKLTPEQIEAVARYVAQSAGK